jgi:hypothetical protein
MDLFRSVQAHLHLRHHLLWLRHDARICDICRNATPPCCAARDLGPDLDTSRRQTRRRVSAVAPVACHACVPEIKPRICQMGVQPRNRIRSKCLSQMKGGLDTGRGGGSLQVLRGTCVELLSLEIQNYNPFRVYPSCIKSTNPEVANWQGKTKLGKLKRQSWRCLIIPNTLFKRTLKEQ